MSNIASKLNVLQYIALVGILIGSSSIMAAPFSSTNPWGGSLVLGMFCCGVCYFIFVWEQNQGKISGKDEQ